MKNMSKDFIPRGNLKRIDRIKKNVPKTYPFAVCAYSLQDDLNLNLIYRSLANFSGLEMFIVGAKTWRKGATNGLHDILKITYFQNTNQFLSHVKKLDYNLIAIEQSNKSIMLNEFVYPKKPCFIFGNESYGLKDDLLLNVENVVEIPMNGFHPSANVGVAAGIIMYDYTTKFNLY